MISDILLDLQATINSPMFVWPTVQKDVKGIILEGYKYTLVCSDLMLSSYCAVSVYDPDEFLIELDEAQNHCVKYWVITNVLPNYLNEN